MALLENKVAIITGAGRGLGEAYARRLAEHGAAVVVNDLGKDENGALIAETVAQSIVAAGGKAAANTADISTMEGGASLLKTALDNFGSADILINNAGILRDKSFLKLTENDWDSVLGVNLKGMFTVTQPVFAWMKENGGGVIVNTSSTSGLVGNFGQLNYAAAKAGVFGMSNVLTIEGAKAGIRVWTLAPAATSALTAPLMNDEQKQLLDPSHVAEAMLYMVSDLSGNKTGHCLFASGQSIRELKLVSAEGIRGRGENADLTAEGIAAAADAIFVDAPTLTIQDFAK
ncbi:MAG: SDR family NAD(P)-dependent oxidoreductase [Spongiibacter sp.]|uniref:SDR family NAD(P)-dependent oxidoreductase n=1 Tax=Spongiibacter thalassae TaxID=2721624 RepID=A0ABX1GDC9_9GAMM|nr:SDR family NAD(P)-dependent oxidoreductase [Spongiibacter thalassae]MDX1504094.1 SDR family NAD(P)-dependent oxidoreductase [Spongiibacter sp.]NKI16407.1 SDR family NAD(P)-dependent oxidoreductase [Spongiibacter thalassae]